MSKDGFLHYGTAEFASGAAASINIGFVARKQKEHDRLYSHSFPGAHSKSLQRDALILDFRVGARTQDAGGLIPFVVLVDNERTGHKMPSGRSDLRFMWLVVTATALDGTVIPFSPHASTRLTAQIIQSQGLHPMMPPSLETMFRQVHACTGRYWLMPPVASRSFSMMP